MPATSSAADGIPPGKQAASHHALLPSPLEGVISAGDHLVLVAADELPTGSSPLLEPHLHVLRDALERNAIVSVMKKSNFRTALGQLGHEPRLVICDSPILADIAASIPASLAVTTFSILLARSKGDFAVFAKDALAVTKLRSGDRVLIAESSAEHFPGAEVGRKLIPQWITQHIATGVSFDIHDGPGLPQDLTGYRMILQCVGCVISREEMAARIQRAHEAGVPITGYGFCIAAIFGKLDRVVELFES